MGRRVLRAEAVRHQGLLCLCESARGEGLALPRGGRAVLKGFINSIVNVCFNLEIIELYCTMGWEELGNIHRRGVELQLSSLGGFITHVTNWHFKYLSW